MKIYNNKSGSIKIKTENETQVNHQLNQCKLGDIYTKNKN
jgi:hypothetical protein